MRSTIVLLSGLFVGSAACAGAVDLPGDSAATRNEGSVSGHRHHHGTSSQETTGDWTAYPLIAPVMGPPGADRGTASLAVRHTRVATLDVFSPRASATPTPFPVSDGRARISASADAGNYHWVVARTEAADRITVASTVVFFANPGPAPTAMLARPKSELEIIPQPLPREHSSYRESETWRFVVRFKGQPLSGARVAFESEHGSRASYMTDGNGLVVVTFPGDVPETSGAAGQSHHMGPPRAKFVLAVEHDDAGRHYLTAFNYTYSTGADRGRSYWAGIGFGVLGMLLATPLLRRKKNDSAARG